MSKKFLYLVFALTAAAVMAFGSKAEALDITLDVEMVQITNLDYTYAADNMAGSGSGHTLEFPYEPGFKLSFVDSAGYGLSITRHTGEETSKATGNLDYFMTNSWNLSYGSCTGCTVETDASVEYLVVDLDLRRELVKVGDMSLNAIIGFRAVKVDETIDTDYDKGGAFPEKVAIDYAYTGYGPKFALEGDIEVSDSFSIVALFGAALLNGDTEFDYKHTETATVKFSKEENRVNPMFEAEIKGVFHLGEHAALGLGYVISHLDGVQTPEQFVDDWTPGGTNTTESIGTQGVTLSFTYGF
ncbi:MAG: Lpg1974 family pore-forming outer membrane protein [Deltaproteobacteria bacterium]|nr:Lpg1974 family pore-forming outer membrane protein [Deltaproteobacteria bacterium]